MVKSNAISFEATLLRPANDGDDDSWAFLVLPKAASEQLPRRGRTSVEGAINNCPFDATLDPDGQLSHWLKVSKTLRDAAGISVGDIVSVEMSPVDVEPEPKLPDDFQEALSASPEAMAVWNDTTTIARVDWIHWITSAKRSSTRTKRIADACDMLASSKRRVCCFDPSGYYSKAFSAPRAKE